MRRRNSLIGLGAAVALFATAGLPLTSNADPIPSEELAAAAVELPPTIPSLDGWAATTGDWTLTDGTRVVAPAEFQTQAETFAAELDVYLNPGKAQTDLRPATPGAVPVITSGADADDIEVILDAGRSGELGAEGYELVIASGGVDIVAADVRGAFYGTRSLSQLLRQQDTLPAGSVVDVPKYSERGITLCACQINIQNDFIDRVLTDMADLKLNHLLLEMKLETSDARHNTWSYYTKDDIAEVVAKADAFGIDVIPEINSPGHMGIWLENRPDLQLRNNAGVRQPNQLDISHPDALDFYTGLIDEYAGVFTTDYWHMGADEYMIGTSFANYTDLTNWAKARYGATATIGDAFIAFINQVNAHVKAQDLQLRIWNDGVIRTDVVQLDPDIIVEFWYTAGLTPPQLIERGYTLMNANDALYFSRSALGYKMNSQNLWNNNWNVGTFPGSGNQLDPDHPNILGAKVSVWPDTSYFQTENEVEAEIFDSFRFISQLTWQGDHHDATGTDMTWDTFNAGIDSIGRNPLWLNVDRRPLGDGTYEVSLAGEVLGDSGAAVSLSADGTDTWHLVSTPDYYYQLQLAGTDQCLALLEGTKHLGVVTEVGAMPELATCVDAQSTSREGAAARNPQKWAIIPTDGGYILRNALTNQDLASIDGTEQHIDFSAAPTTDTALSDQSLRPAVGAVAQLPPDMTDAAWTFAVRSGATATTDVASVHPGSSATVVVAVTASSEGPLTGVVVSPQPVDGLTVTPATVELGTIPAGQTVTATFTVTGGPAISTRSLVFDAEHDGGTLNAGVTLSTSCGPESTPVSFASDSQEPAEGGGSGFLSAAFDGNPATYWHTQWNGGNPPYPHWVTMDAGAEVSLCSINYLPRQGRPNGRVKDYNVYLSDDGSNWGEPVASGSFPNTGDWQRIVLAEPTLARYVKFEGLNAQVGETAQDPWMSAAEFTLTAGSAVEPTPVPTATATVTASTTATATATTTATATATTTATATATTTATVTSTATATATATTTATTTATATATATSSATQTVWVTATPTATSRPSDGSWVYVTPGTHLVNGRKWFTECEPYSQTTRCRTDIWSTQTRVVDGGYVQVTGWHFNNLTYLPSMTRAQWGSNPLASTGSWTSEGRKWRTECDTAATGGNGCRSYIVATVVEPSRAADGSWTYRTVNKEVFNNIVLFRA